MALPEVPLASAETPIPVETTSAMDTDDNNDARDRDYSFMDEDPQSQMMMGQRTQTQPSFPVPDREQPSFMRMDAHHGRMMEPQQVIPQKRHLPGSEDRPGTGFPTSSFPASSHPREGPERRATRPNGSATPRQQNGMSNQRSSTMQNPQQKKRMMAPPNRQGAVPVRRPGPKPAPQVQQTRPPRALTDNSSDTVIILDDDEDQGIEAIKQELAAAASEEQHSRLPAVNPPPRIHLSQAQHELPQPHQHQHQHQRVQDMRTNSGHNPQLARAVERVNSNEAVRQHQPGSQGHPRRTPSGRSSGSQQQTMMSAAPESTAVTTEGTLANAVAQLSQQKGSLEKKLQDTIHALKAKSQTVEEMAHKNGELTTSIEEYKKKVEAMRTRYTEFEKFLDGLGSDYKMLNEQKMTLTRRIEELEVCNRELEADRRLLHDRIDDAMNNQQSWREAKKQYDQLLVDHEKLQDAHAAATRELNDKGMYLVEEKNRNVSLEAQMVRERETHEEVVKVLNGFKHELVENIKSLEVKLADLNSAKTDGLQLT